MSVEDTLRSVARIRGVALLMFNSSYAATHGTLALPEGARVERFTIPTDALLDAERTVDVVVGAADRLFARVRAYLDEVAPIPKVSPVAMLAALLMPSGTHALDQEGVLVVRLLAAVQRKDWHDVGEAAAALRLRGKR